MVNSAALSLQSFVIFKESFLRFAAGGTRHPGGRRELLVHVADIANILALQDARSVNDPALAVAGSSTS
jgi:hypothetical protein